MRALTKKAESWKVGVSGVPWLYTDTRRCSAAALLTLPDDRVRSSTSKGLQEEKKKRRRDSRSAAVNTFVHQEAKLCKERFFFRHLRVWAWSTYYHVTSRLSLMVPRSLTSTATT